PTFFRPETKMGKGLPFPIFDGSLVTTDVLRRGTGPPLRVGVPLGGPPAPPQTPPLPRGRPRPPPSFLPLATPTEVRASAGGAARGRAPWRGGREVGRGALAPP